MLDLTDKQKAILAYIEKYLVENMRPPSVREIGEAFGVAGNTITTHFESMLERKFLLKDSFASRGLRLPGMLIYAERRNGKWRVLTKHGEVTHESLNEALLMCPKEGP